MGAGYRLDELYRLGLRQLDAFLQAAQQRKKSDMVSMAINQRVSYHADGEQFTKYSEDLTKD